MTNQEIMQIFIGAQAIGMKTVGDLARFKKEKGCRTNQELLDAIKAAQTVAA